MDMAFKLLERKPKIPGKELYNELPNEVMRFPLESISSAVVIVIQ